MGSAQLKEELQKYIEQADERFLKVIHTMMKEYVRELEIVGFNHEGVPIAKEELVIRARHSNQAIKKGKVKSLKQVQKESTNW